MSLVPIIIALAGISPNLAGKYSREITKYARRADIEPLLVVSVIYAESRFRANAVSHTNDYGLGQIHVSDTTRSEYIGKESLLFDYSLNIRLSITALRYWRKYHERKCGKHSTHHWISHYNHGGIVRNSRYERKVLQLYRRLKVMSRPLL